MMLKIGGDPNVVAAVESVEEDIAKTSLSASVLVMVVNSVVVRVGTVMVVIRGIREVEVIVSPPTDTLRHKGPEQGAELTKGVVLGGPELVDTSVNVPPADGFGKVSGSVVTPSDIMTCGDTLGQRRPVQSELPAGVVSVADEPPGAVVESPFGPEVGSGSVGSPFTVAVPPRLLTHSRSVQPYGKDADVEPPFAAVIVPVSVGTEVRNISGNGVGLPKREMLRLAQTRSVQP